MSEVVAQELEKAPIWHKHWVARVFLVRRAEQQERHQRKVVQVRMGLVAAADMARAPMVSAALVEQPFRYTHPIQMGRQATLVAAEVVQIKLVEMADFMAVVVVVQMRLEAQEGLAHRALPFSLILSPATAAEISF